MPPIPARTLANIDPVDDLLARLRLDHTARENGALIVEGPTDRRALSCALDIDRRRIFQAAGRPNVLRCARQIAERPLAGVVCVADRDFDESESNWPGVTWMVFFDHADLESMIAQSPALDRFLEEWAAPGKLAEYGGPNAVRARVLETLRPLSAARAENFRRQLGISFSDLHLPDVIGKDGALRIIGLVARLASASTAERTEIEAAMSADAPMCPHTGVALARGRDALALVGVLLRKQIGTLNMHQTRTDFVERSLRLALAPGDFNSAPFSERLRDAMTAVIARPVPHTP